MSEERGSRLSSAAQRFSAADVCAREDRRCSDIGRRFEKILDFLGIFVGGSGLYISSEPETGSYLASISTVVKYLTLKPKQRRRYDKG